MRAQIAAQGQAVAAGQGEVEHDQVDGRSVEHLLHGITVGCRADMPALLAEIVGQQTADVRIVVYDQDARRCSGVVMMRTLQRNPRERATDTNLYKIAGTRHMRDTSGELNGHRA